MFVPNQAFDEALTSKSAMPRPFMAADLVRGYRFDIWSSQDSKWHSLHRRHSTYSFGTSGDPVLHIEDEEGFTQLAAAQPAQDPAQPPPAPTPGDPPPFSTDVYIHERIAGWNGWSLSVQRPGGSLNRDPDPEKALDEDPTLNQPLTPFKMVSTFKPVDGSLPRLRFGTRYRLRARTVDLAGNSVPLANASPAGFSLPSGTDLPYLRFEPVPTPVVVLSRA